MLNNVLFVFEGIKTENKIVESLEKNFFLGKTVIKSVFDGEIYQLYEQLQRDEFLDIYSILKERHPKNLDLFEKYTRNDFAEIYLFFDYEGQATKATDEKIEKMLAFFCEETEQGKLYISYPMVEALKHIPIERESFKDLIVLSNENIGYKKLVNQTGFNRYKDYRKYNKDIWTELIDLHLCKANYLVNGSFQFPKDLISPEKIFERQRSNYINPEFKVAVISAFPCFIHDYFGNKELIKILV
jgi:hypothetical protein